MPSLARSEATPVSSTSCGNGLQTLQTVLPSKAQALSRRRKWAIRKGLREIRGWRAAEAAGPGQPDGGPLPGGRRPSALLLALCVGCVSKGGFYCAGPS